MPLPVQCATPNCITGHQSSTPAAHSPIPNGSTFNEDEHVTLSNFRLLMGLPGGKGDDFPHPPSKLKTPHIIPQWIRNCYTTNDEEAPTSLYYELITEERHVALKYRLYEWIVYGGLMFQLMLSAILIILGALKSNHIPISVLSAANGVVTGILSLIKGQGLPMRLIKYLDALRKVRDEIDFAERQLRANLSSITFRDVLKLKSKYEAVRQDQMANQPDVWQNSSGSNGSNGNTNGNSNMKE
jgi:hypothetical protein